jgi:hypothetical protein
MPKPKSAFVAFVEDICERTWTRFPPPGHWKLKDKVLFLHKEIKTTVQIEHLDLQHNSHMTTPVHVIGSLDMTSSHRERRNCKLYTAIESTLQR